MLAEPLVLQSHRRTETALGAAVAVCVGLVLTAGCSTLQIQDAYRLPNGGSEFEIAVPDGDAVVGFQPATRLYSLGLVGAPLIPTVIKRHSPAEINLSVRLTLHADHDFAFPPSVCVRSDTAAELCSDTAFIHAYAIFQDDGSAYRDKHRRWQHIAPFFDSKRAWYEAITPSENDVSFDRAAVYRHYGYVGSPKWDLLSVEMVYHVPCPSPDPCPSSAALNLRDLVRVGSAPPASQEIAFHHVRVRDYRPVTDPGP